MLGKGKTVPQEIEAAKKAADEVLAKVDGELERARAEYQAAEQAAKAALKPRRDQAIQDLLWALFNTKEFVFNH